MLCRLIFLFRLAAAVLKSRRYLLLENAALRHQLLVLNRNANRPRWDPVHGELLILAFEGLLGVPCPCREAVVLSRDYERVTVAARAVVDHACDAPWTWRVQEGRRPKSAPQTATPDDPADPEASA